MDTYRRYQQARDTAWRALLRCREKQLPIDAEALAREVGAQVLLFPPSEEEPKLYEMACSAGCGAAVSLRIRGVWHIFVRPGLDDAHRRFAVAHELGHLFLSHDTYVLSPGVRTFHSRENEGDLMEDPDSLEDYAADIFAIRLLAPACLLHEMHIDSPSGVMAACGLPLRAARMRAERMELLNGRDAFYTHPLERQVRDAFLLFLRQYAVPEKQAAPTHPEAPVLETPAVIVPLESKETEGTRKKSSPRRIALIALGGILAVCAALLLLLGR